MINNPKYISDLITTPEIQTWMPGDRILISAPTGAGKTQFVTTILYEHAKSNNKKILLLENRIILKDQIKHSLEEGYSETMDIILYQHLESKIKKNGYSSEGIFDEYDYVFADESHYFAGDSAFNAYSDLVLNAIIRNHSNTILIFASATPYSLTETTGIIRNTKPPYIIKPDFSFINRLYFYNKNETVEQVLKSLPENEKAIFFGNAQQSRDLNKQFRNSSFACARSNGNYYKPNSEEDSDILLTNQIDETTREIVENESFSSKYLFTTRVMDNGVSIKDSSVKTMIIADSLDLVVLVQMIGRIRILDPKQDKINIYIKNHYENVIKSKIRDLVEIIEKVDEHLKIGMDEFISENKKTVLPNVFDTDGQLNYARYTNTKFQLSKYQLMLSQEYKYRQIVCNILEQKIEDTKFAEREFFQMSAEDILYKYQERKLFRDEQKSFREEFLGVVINKREAKKLGYNTIRGILKDTKNNLRFKIDRGIETRGENNKKHFWYIYKLSEGEAFDDEEIFLPLEE